jgi:hypothetical protein
MIMSTVDPILIKFARQFLKEIGLPCVSEFVEKQPFPQWRLDHPKIEYKLEQVDEFFKKESIPAIREIDVTRQYSDKDDDEDREEDVDSSEITNPPDQILVEVSNREFKTPSARPGSIAEYLVGNFTKPTTVIVYALDYGNIKGSVGKYCPRKQKEPALIVKRAKILAESKAVKASSTDLLGEAGVKIFPDEGIESQEVIRTQDIIAPLPIPRDPVIRRAVPFETFFGEVGLCPESLLCQADAPVYFNITKEAITSEFNDKKCRIVRNVNNRVHEICEERSFINIEGNIFDLTLFHYYLNKYLF